MREPDYSRENRRAWKSQAEHTKKEHQGHLATFLVNSPIAHPIWSYWMVALVHLRDIPGVPPARKHYPDAEFEFAIASIDPDHGIPDPDKGPWPLLEPLDCVVQLHGVTDEQAAELCEKAVQLMVHQGISPDSDNRGWWKIAIWNAVEHVTTGHPEGSA